MWVPPRMSCLCFWFLSFSKHGRSIREMIVGAGGKHNNTTLAKNRKDISSFIIRTAALILTHRGGEIGGAKAWRDEYPQFSFISRFNNIRVIYRSCFFYLLESPQSCVRRFAISAVVIFKNTNE